MPRCVYFDLLFLITLRGIRPIRSGMSGVCLRSNRATGVTAVCYGLTGPVCFKVAGIISATGLEFSRFTTGSSPSLSGLI